MNKLLLSLLQPRAESWDAMTPTSAGRHCAACQKTVVDFTHKTDAEILTYLGQAAGRTCGRFRVGQLARPLQPVASASRWRSWLGALLTAGSLGATAVKASAQVAPATCGGGPPLVAGAAGTAAAPASPAIQPALPPPPTSSLTEVTGIVHDARHHEPLPGAVVLLKGTTIGVATDADGHFALQLPAGVTSAQLVVSYIGYASCEQRVTTQSGVPLRIALEFDERILGGDVVLVHYRLPYPWQPRALYRWSKFQLTRLFQ